jgi:ABC-type uncharacterized transport system substrate-binding protein
MASPARSQTRVTYSQHLYLIKSLKPSIKIVGVIASTLTPEEIESLARAATGLGVKIVVATISDARNISSSYKNLIREHKVEIVWIPDGGDKLLLETGFEYLRENTILDRIGLCVPSKDLVAAGALCSFENENGKFNVYVNRRIAQVDGITPPSEQDPKIAYIVR